jgi:hypothetical protein
MSGLNKGRMMAEKNDWNIIASRTAKNELGQG